MAQLIKLNDYISRYESDLSRYISLFVRLKKRRWATMVANGAYHKREEELKRDFLDRLFISQIKWASSTITKKSYPHSSVYSDVRLRGLIQRLPDTVLIMYNPVFQLKKAKMQLEVILITPSRAYCLAFLDGEENALYIGTNDHFWQEKAKSGKKKVLNPALSVRRMDIVVRQIFQISETELPIDKVIITENGYITHRDQPDDILLIDKQNYESWINELRSYKTPMKMMQFRAARALLDRCLKAGVKRS